MYGLISSFLENWTSFYSNHAVIRTFIGFFHVGGLLLGGGCAIAADRSILLASRLHAHHALPLPIRAAMPSTIIAPLIPPSPT